MNDQKTIKERITALKQTMKRVDGAMMDEINAMAAVSGEQGGSNSSEVFAQCPGWREFSQWSQWFN